MEAERLEQAIQHAVAAIAAPDDARLAAILARLEQAPASRPAPRRTVWPWLLLAAAGAAAAGAGYRYVQISNKQAVTNNGITGHTVSEPALSQPVLPPTSRPMDEEGSGGDSADNNASLIYRR